MSSAEAGEVLSRDGQKEQALVSRMGTSILNLNIGQSLGKVRGQDFEFIHASVILGVPCAKIPLFCYFRSLYSCPIRFSELMSP